MNKFIKQLIMLSVMLLEASSSIGAIGKNSVRILLILTGVAWSTLALAEGGCPEGQFPQQYGTTMGCTTMNAGGNQPVAPVWADRWGAIANDTKGIFGIVSNLRSKRQAEKAAIEECRKRGGGACKVDYTYHNQCVAVGGNDAAANTASGPDLDEVKVRAVRNCEAQSNKKCIVFYSGCSMPVRVN
ncbi:DUF4189 domain-containing protein [Acinetobacter higginsii]|uniref:DUF4189 domain-containing protein n=1 Tax=Acinetobacter higginsii TaxID=70347 RepID=UPI001F4B4F92|nr:DUF4189 domain-containing protein [Acinetobacter higginsii]MCH7294310.1 DUF4189 domain-containing protein [Acinetobacter higginsii]